MREDVPISRLVRIAAKAADGDVDQRWLAATIKEVLEGRGSFDQAFGIDWTQRLGARDEKIREVHRRYFPKDKPYAAAARIEQLAKDVRKLRAAGGFGQIALR
jgi:hypothetical protein